MILKNRKVAQVAYTISTIVIVVMLIAAMSDESHAPTYEKV